MALGFLAVVLFLILFSLCLLAFGLALRFTEARRQKQLGGLLDVLTERIEASQIKVLIQNADRSGEGIRRFLARLNVIGYLDSRVRQAGLDWTMDRLALTMLAGAVIGGLAGFRFPIVLARAPSILVLGCAGGLVPWLYVLRARRKRLAQFEAQFPETLDFLARALRAGHAFSISLGMLGRESIEPVRTEFSRVYNEQSLGESIPIVLQHLAERVPLVDVRFFVSAVLMQRETGGNLAEILTRLATVIRERFRVKGQVRSASAHGRITAGVLTVMPLATALGLSRIAPGYLPGMLRDQAGRYLLFGAILAQAAGYFIMRRIVNIKV